MTFFNIAHRGASGDFPENSMIAFKKALEMNSNGIELDVHLTKDKVPVIIHDEQVNRTTTSTGYIKDYTYKQLRKLDCGIKKNKKFEGEKIPSLDEFLEYVKDKNILINIELKNNLILYQNLEKIVIDRLYKYGVNKNTVLSSFNHYSLKKCKDIDSSIKTGILYMCGLYNPDAYAKSLNCDCLHSSFHCIDKNIVKRAHDNNLIVNCFTVNNKNYMKNLIDINVDGIITNYPDILDKMI